MRTKSLFILLVCFFMAAPSVAETLAATTPTQPQSAANSSENVTNFVFGSKRPRTRFEFGMGLGTPGGINVNLGGWSNYGFPYVLRLSAGFAGFLAGAYGTVGLQFIRTEAFRAYAGVMGGGYAWTFFDSGDYTGIGPTLGFSLYRFKLSTGILFGGGDHIDFLSKNSSSVSGPRLHIQLGYSFIF